MLLHTVLTGICFAVHSAEVEGTDRASFLLPRQARYISIMGPQLHCLGTSTCPGVCLVWLWLWLGLALLCSRIIKQGQMLKII